MSEKYDICNTDNEKIDVLIFNDKISNILPLNGHKMSPVDKVNPTVNRLTSDVNFSVNSCTRKYTCPECEFETVHKSSFSRHKKTCKQKPLSNNLVTDIKTKHNSNECDENLKIKCKELELEIKYMERENKLLNTIVANANSVINKTANIANTNAQTAQVSANVSISALKYANERFKDAPILAPIENFNINDLNFENDRQQLIETLIYNAKQKSLDKLLGDHIVKYYKKDNPEEQSFHTTDCSRLNYIVRDLIEDAVKWGVDKNGIKICTAIVKPLIGKCINILMEHQKELLQEMSTGDFTKQNNVQLIIDVLMSIDKGSLEADINKYIAPFFNINKI
jgi:hypothetical protein